MFAFKSEWNQNQINADIALKNRLYVSGYLLSGILIDIRSGVLSANVVLHFEDNNPVGVAVHVLEDDYYDYQLMVFVRKSKRGNGIGSKLLKSLKAPEGCIVGRGCKASYPFWHKTGYFNVA